MKRVVLAALLALALTGCAPGEGAPAVPTEACQPTTTAVQVEGTIVRFERDGAYVDVTVRPETPATRDFLSLLPLTLTVEEFAGQEKIADLPRQLAHEGTPGSDPEDGDLIYFTPWGNLGFYYDTSGIDFDDRVLHLGTYTATEKELAVLEGPGVTVRDSDTVQPGPARGGPSAAARR